MDIETALRRVAIGSAIFLLFGPVGGRTMWVRGHTTTTDAGFYNMTAVFSGVVALALLAIALWGRERDWRALPALSALISAIAFALSVFMSGLFVWARLQGEIWFYGTGWFAGDMDRKTTVHLPWGPPFFALVALVGAIASLGLAVTWLRQPKADADTAVSVAVP